MAKVPHLRSNHPGLQTAFDSLKRYLDGVEERVGDGFGDISAFIEGGRGIEVVEGQAGSVVIQSKDQDFDNLNVFDAIRVDKKLYLLPGYAHINTDDPDDPPPVLVYSDETPYLDGVSLFAKPRPSFALPLTSGSAYKIYMVINPCVEEDEEEETDDEDDPSPGDPPDFGATGGLDTGGIDGGDGLGDNGGLETGGTGETTENTGSVSRKSNPVVQVIMLPASKDVSKEVPKNSHVLVMHEFECDGEGFPIFSDETQKMTAEPVICCPIECESSSLSSSVESSPDSSEESSPESSEESSDESSKESQNGSTAFSGSRSSESSDDSSEKSDPSKESEDSDESEESEPGLPSDGEDESGGSDGGDPPGPDPEESEEESEESGDDSGDGDDSKDTAVVPCSHNKDGNAALYCEEATLVLFNDLDTLKGGILKRWFTRKLSLQIDHQYYEKCHPGSVRAFGQGDNLAPYGLRMDGQTMHVTLSRWPWNRPGQIEVYFKGIRKGKSKIRLENRTDVQRRFNNQRIRANYPTVERAREIARELTEAKRLREKGGP